MSANNNMESEIKEIESISFGMMSSEDIRQMSSFEVKNCKDIVHKSFRKRFMIQNLVLLVLRHVKHVIKTNGIVLDILDILS